MGRDRGHRCRRYPMGRLCPLTSTSTTVLRSSLAMGAIARDVKCSDGMSFNRMKQERGSTCRAAGAGGRRGNAGTSPPPGRHCTSGSGDRLENRHSMPDAGCPLRCSCVGRRSLPSKSTVGTGSESPMSARVPAGSPSSGLPMIQPWCGPTRQTDGSLSCGLHRTRPPEGSRPTDCARRGVRIVADVEEVEVELIVAHNERATLRVGDVFLKIDADQTRTDVEVEAMAMAPIPTPEILWRKPPVLALAALPGTALGHLGELSTASPAAWAAAGAAARTLHDTPLPPWPGRSLDELASRLDGECEWLVADGVLPADLVTRNRQVAEI